MRDAGQVADGHLQTLNATTLDTKNTEPTYKTLLLPTHGNELVSTRTSLQSLLARDQLPNGGSVTLLIHCG